MVDRPAPPLDGFNSPSHYDDGKIIAAWIRDAQSTSPFAHRRSIARRMLLAVFDPIGRVPN
jgi:hypothetical protein